MKFKVLEVATVYNGQLLSDNLFKWSVFI